MFALLAPNKATMGWACWVLQKEGEWRREQVETVLTGFFLGLWKTQGHTVHMQGVKVDFFSKLGSFSHEGKNQKVFT